MDAAKLFPNGFHPQLPFMERDNSRMARPLLRSSLKEPIRYYFIDFGISTWFRDSFVLDENATDDEKVDARLREKRLVLGARGQDTLIADLDEHVPYDPFALDIALLGRMILKVLVNVRSLSDRFLGNLSIFLVAGALQH